ncbi:MAG: hypothetical protein AAF587_36120 [Bacteroidota bacterium]
MSKTKTHHIGSENKASNSISRAEFQGYRDFFSHFGSESESSLLEASFLFKGGGNNPDGTLSRKKERKLLQKLRKSDAYSIPDHHTFHINKIILKRYWEAFYSKLFLQRHGIGQNGKAMSWSAFKSKYVAPLNVFEYEISVPNIQWSSHERELIPLNQSVEESPEELEEAPVYARQEQESTDSREVSSQVESQDRANGPDTDDLSAPIQEPIKETEELLPDPESLRELFKPKNRELSTHKLDAWIQKSIDRGWTPEDPIPSVHHIKVDTGEEMFLGRKESVSYIYAYSYSEAYAYAKEQGMNGLWYRISPLSEKKVGQIQRIGSIETYNRSRYQYSEKLIEDLYAISKNQQLYEAAKGEGPILGYHFAQLVKDVQKKIMPKDFQYPGMYTPETKEQVEEHIKLLNQQAYERQQKMIQEQEALIQSIATKFLKVLIEVSGTDQPDSNDLLKVVDAINSTEEKLGTEKKNQILKIFVKQYSEVYDHSLFNALVHLGKTSLSKEKRLEAMRILFEFSRIDEKIDAYINNPDWVSSMFTQGLISTDTNEEVIVYLLDKPNLSPDDWAYLHDNPTYVTETIKDHFDYHEDEYYQIRKQLGPLGKESWKDIVHERITMMKGFWDDDESSVLNAMLDLSPKDRRDLFIEMREKGEWKFMENSEKAFWALKQMSISRQNKPVETATAAMYRIALYNDEEGVEHVGDIIQMTDDDLKYYQKFEQSQDLQNLNSLRFKEDLKRHNIGIAFSNTYEGNSNQRTLLALSKLVQVLKKEREQMKSISTNQTVLKSIEDNEQKADLLTKSGDNPLAQKKATLLSAGSYMGVYNYETILSILRRVTVKEYRSFFLDPKVYQFLNGFAEAIAINETGENYELEYSLASLLGTPIPPKKVLTERGKQRKQAFLKGMYDKDTNVLSEIEIIGGFAINDREHTIFAALLAMDEEQRKTFFHNNRQFAKILAENLNEEEKAIVLHIIKFGTLPSSTFDYAVGKEFDLLDPSSYDEIGTSEEVLKLYFQNLSSEEKEKFRWGYILDKGEINPTYEGDEDHEEEKAYDQASLALFRKYKNKLTATVYPFGPFNPGVSELEEDEYQDMLDLFIVPTFGEYEHPERIAHFLHYRIQDKHKARTKFFNGNEFSNLGEVLDLEYRHFNDLFEKVKKSDFSEDGVNMLIAAAASYDNARTEFHNEVDQNVAIATAVVGIVVGLVVEICSAGTATPLITSLISMAASSGATLSIQAMSGRLTMSDAGEVLVNELISFGVSRVLQSVGDGLTIEKAVNKLGKEVTKGSTKLGVKNIVKKYGAELGENITENVLTEVVLTGKDLLLLEQSYYEILKSHGDDLLSAQNVSFTLFESALGTALGSFRKKTTSQAGSSDHGTQTSSKTQKNHDYGPHLFKERNNPAQIDRTSDQGGQNSPTSYENQDGRSIKPEDVNENKPPSTYIEEKFGKDEQGPTKNTEEQDFRSYSDEEKIEIRQNEDHIDQYPTQEISSQASEKKKIETDQSHKSETEFRNTNLSYEIDKEGNKTIKYNGKVVATEKDGIFYPNKWGIAKTGKFENEYTGKFIMRLQSGHILIQLKNGKYAFDLGFKDGRVLTPEEVNSYHKGIGQHPPYRTTNPVIERTLTEGDPIYIVELKNGGNPNPGGWGSKNQMKKIQDIREDLAILEKWKNNKGDDLVVRKYIVKSKVVLQVRDGVVGPMLDFEGKIKIDDLEKVDLNTKEYMAISQKDVFGETKDILAGGEQQYYLIDNIRGENWKKYFKDNPEEFSIEGGRKRQSSNKESENLPLKQIHEGNDPQNQDLNQRKTDRDQTNEDTKSIEEQPSTDDLEDLGDPKQKTKNHIEAEAKTTYEQIQAEGYGGQFSKEQFVDRYKEGWRYEFTQNSPNRRWWIKQKNKPALSEGGEAIVKAQYIVDLDNSFHSSLKESTRAHDASSGDVVDQLPELERMQEKAYQLRMEDDSFEQWKQSVSDPETRNQIEKLRLNNWRFYSNRIGEISSAIYLKILFPGIKRLYPNPNLSIIDSQSRPGDFDQVWQTPDGRIFIIESKGGEGGNSTRIYEGQEVEQGSEKYFLAIIKEMEKSGQFEENIATELKKMMTESGTTNIRYWKIQNNLKGKQKGINTLTVTEYII